MQNRQDMGSYRLDLYRHVKIWFSDDEDSFLNPENQLRLIRFRVQNPTDTLSFIYDKRLLSITAQKELQKFCEIYHIEAIDLQELESELANDSEKELMFYVEEEIRHAKEKTGGNFAAASDILRWLSPVYKRGIYADFDTKVTTEGLPANLRVYAPVIANVGSSKALPEGKISSFALTSQHERLICNNDIFAIPGVDTEALPSKQEFSHQLQQEKINAVHKEIIDSYRAPNLSFSRYLAKYKQVLDEIYANSVIVDKTLRQNFNPHIQIALGKFGSTIFEIRRNIEQKLAAKNASEGLQSPSTFYKTTVTHMTGPRLISSLFSATIFTDEQRKKEHSYYSWQHYGLDEHFISGQFAKFGTSLEEMRCKVSSTLYDACDASWTKEGREAVKKREERMDASARFIQMWCKRYLQQKKKSLPETGETYNARHQI